jgi:hypothetical protein
MKCSNPDCNRGIGLVSYRRSWFDKLLYCSKRCRDAGRSHVAERQSSHHRRTMSYVDWLFSQSARRPQQRLRQRGIRVTASFV